MITRGEGRGIVIPQGDGSDEADEMRRFKRACQCEQLEEDDPYRPAVCRLGIGLTIYHLGRVIVGRTHKGRCVGLRLGEAAG